MLCLDSADNTCSTTSAAVLAAQTQGTYSIRVPLTLVLMLLERQLGLERHVAVEAVTNAAGTRAAHHDLGHACRQLLVLCQDSAGNTSAALLAVQKPAPRTATMLVPTGCLQLCAGLLLLPQNAARRNVLLAHVGAALCQLQHQLDALDAFVSHHFKGPWEAAGMKDSNRHWLDTVAR